MTSGGGSLSGSEEVVQALGGTEQMTAGPSIDQQVSVGRGAEAAPHEAASG
jgi:hypothetical protein